MDNLNPTSYDIKKELPKKLPITIGILDVLVKDLNAIGGITENIFSNTSIKDDDKVIQLHLVFQNLILTLTKYNELYEKYKDILNYFVSNKLCKKIYDELKQVDINHLRNKYVAHIHDKDTNEPITQEKLNSYFSDIDERHKSLQAFFYKAYSYPFFDGDGEPLNKLLESCKNQLITAIGKDL